MQFIYDYWFEQCGGSRALVLEKYLDMEPQYSIKNRA